jgi:hypothetical protein
MKKTFQECEITYDPTKPYPDCFNRKLDVVLMDGIGGILCEIDRIFDAGGNHSPLSIGHAIMPLIIDRAATMQDLLIYSYSVNLHIGKRMEQIRQMNKPKANREPEIVEVSNMDELLAQGNPDAKRLMELIGAVEELKAAINEGMELIVHISRKLANDKKPTNNDGKQA